MTNEARAAQRAYLAEWRKRNPEKVRENNRRYWEKKAKKIRESEGDNIAEEKV